MRFLSRVSYEVDSDRMLRLAYDVQLQLLAARRKVLLENQSVLGRKSRLPTCWLAQVEERLSTYNLCIDSDQLPPCARLKQLAERQYIEHHQVATADSSRVRAYLGLNSSTQYGYKEYLSKVDNAQLRRSDALPSHGGETQVRVSQSQVAELGLGSTLPASNSRKG
jgi:hypothetical protein